MPLLFIDTETTGLPRFSLPPDHPSQPRMCQLAAILADADGTVRSGCNLIIRPAGWTIPPEVTAVHGLTDRDCERYGVELGVAVGVLSGLAHSAEKIVAHNVKFDAFVLEGECRRVLGTASVMPPPERHYCTMLGAAPYCQIPKSGDGWKWPKLGEAYRHFFGSDLEQAHRAGADVKACMRIYFAIQSASAVAAVAR